MSTTDSSASPQLGAMWLELGLTLGAMLGAGLVAGTLHGAPSLALRPGLHRSDVAGHADVRFQNCV